MLKISRPDIDRYQITELAPDRRFIKLPIENYLKLATVGGVPIYDNLNCPQIALINAVNSPNYRFICAALSRRLGKTFIANVIGQLVVLIPGCNVLIMSPNYNLSTISFDLQRTFIRQFDLELVKDNHKDRIIELTNGSTIRMGSLSTVDSSVGRSYDLIIFDECALGEGGEEAFNVSLRPTLDRPGSKAIFISTPRGKHNWFAKFWDRGWSVDYPQWISLQADYTENDRMLESDVEEARRSMSKAEFEQEYMASFNTFEGQIYKFSDHLIVEFEHSDGAEYLGGIDPGYRDPTAMVVVAYNPVEDVFHVVDEYLEAEKTTREHAESFQVLIEKWGLDSGIFIDSAAAQFAGDLAYGYDITTIKAKKQVLEGIAYVQTLVEQGRIKVSPHCRHTLEMFDQYQWDSRDTLTREKPVHSKVSHIADALRYCLYTYTI
jgi:hypothetical protein